MKPLPFAALRLAPALLLAFVLTPLREAEPVDLETATIAGLQAAMPRGTLTSEKLAQMYLDRIAGYDQTGPNINTVIFANQPALVLGARPAVAGMAASPWAIANETGFPDLIVPAGMTDQGLPITISFFGLAYTEPKLLGYGYDFEQATHAIRLPKFTPALPTDKFAN